MSALMECRPSHLLHIHHSCQSFSLFHQLFLVVNQAFVCSELMPASNCSSSITKHQVLLTIRTWALYGRNIRVLLFIIGIAALLLGVASVSSLSFYPSFPRFQFDNPVVVASGTRTNFSNCCRRLPYRIIEQEVRSTLHSYFLPVCS